MKQIKSKFEDLFCDDSGSITTLSAICMLGLMVCAGSAIDYSRAKDLVADLSSAADAAALTAIASVEEYEKAGKTGADHLAMSDAIKIWNTNVSSVKGMLKEEPNILVSKSTGVWVAKVSYSGKIPTTILGLLGVTELPITAKSEASTTAAVTGVAAVANTSWEFTFLLDNSASMGIGATQADMNKMTSTIGCSFACHYTWNGRTYRTDNTARAAGAKLRIDVIDKAVDLMIAKYDSISNKSNLKAALYGLNKAAELYVPMTSSLTAVSNYNLELDGVTASQGNTDLHGTLTTMLNAVGQSGDGSSSSKAKKALYIVTDGLHDMPFATPGSTAVFGQRIHQVNVINSATCELIKNNGVKIAVLYINYIDPPGYEGYVDPVRNKFIPSLQSCASPGLFVNAVEPAAIEKAMLGLLDGVMTEGVAAIPGKIRLTQ